MDVLVNSAPSRSLGLGGGGAKNGERSGALGKRLDFPEDENKEGTVVSRRGGPNLG